MYNDTVGEYGIHRKEMWLQDLSYLFYIVKVLIMTISIGLNITVLVTIKLTKRLRTIPYLYMSSLAVSDLTFSCNGIFHSWIVITAVYTNDWPSYQLASRLGMCFTFVFFVAIFSTYGNLILISLERWIYISQPFWYQRRISERLAVYTIVLLWSLCTIMNIDILICGQNFPAVNKQTIRYSILLSSYHFIWCIIICSIYMHIAAITLRHIKAMKQIASVGISTKIDKADLTLVMLKQKLSHARMLLFVFGSFFILLTPSVCCNIYTVIKQEVDGDLLGFAKLLLCSHSCSNFFVYAFQDREFKLALRQLFAKCGFTYRGTKVSPKQVYTSAEEFNTGLNKKAYLSFN